MMKSLYLILNETFLKLNFLEMYAKLSAIVITMVAILTFVFSKNKHWIEYESIQADIFDHILAIIPEFELQVFQSPSGGDIQQLTEKIAIRMN